MTSNRPGRPSACARVKRGAVTVMLIASAATACVGGGRAILSTASPPSSTIDTARLLATTEAGDSLGLAQRIRATCRYAGEASSCYQSLLALPAGRSYVKVAMGALAQLARNDADIRRSGHVYAHAIGIAAGRGPGDVAAKFSQCSESFQSGCYHGVIQAWFAGLDSVGATDANALCAPFRKSDSDRWLRFQCVHGMGHGLTMLYGHDLPKGLAACDLLTEWWDRHSCYSGAFMENIVNVQMPHHPASALASHEMAGMDHGTSGAVPFKPIDPADQQYPCSVLAERYLSACYEMQTSVMLYNNKGDIAGAAKGCDGAPAAMRTTCYASLGRDVSSYSQQKHDEAIRMCSLATEKYQPYCYYGLVKNLIDLQARPSDGISLCRDIPGDRNKTLCYVAVGEEVMTLAGSAELRRELCSPAESEFLDSCLYGARIDGIRVPPILQTIRDAAND